MKTEEVAKPSQLTQRLDSFILLHQTQYTQSNDRHFGTNNSPALSSSKTLWSKNITLKSRELVANVYKQSAFQQFYMTFNEYGSSAECSAAKDSLMGYIRKESSAEWGDSGKTMKTTPFLYIINETTIISCFVSCEQADKTWDNLQQEMLLFFGTAHPTTIKSGCGGPLTFSRQ